ncbi:hypothetical protein D3226_10335 [Leucobacter chromiireducens subsp. chromiireducens]|uniref:Uncharacterized protein n=1 Tax=Leucobacter chromiireducens subsp. chromiireducens TaxID=660067 RepID=A0ABS1SQX7_9MICO|nr:hypothetical protein [Leucobacter chromiireducens subsp. chromiireducens]
MAFTVRFEELLVRLIKFNDRRAFGHMMPFRRILQEEAEPFLAPFGATYRVLETGRIATANLEDEPCFQEPSLC